jgi:type II secretory pathway component PulF
MSLVQLTIYDIGNFIGHWGVIVFIIIMCGGLLFVMKNYLKSDDKKQ